MTLVDLTLRILLLLMFSFTNPESSPMSGLILVNLLLLMSKSVKVDPRSYIRPEIFLALK